VVVPGVTTVVAPVNAPGIQVYVTLPLAVNVVLLPEQIAVGEALAVKVGFGFTINVIVLVLVQAPFAPVTV